ncbi:FecR domain-containing protein [Variovorax sp. HW608]|uniref:FecR domain-containing protein n=1 Tax=Variovorax sp. HW608 TaxID=1034889 RepID=UPI0012FDC008|nr:FecR domain-containing protein [Variovorax sp. HW608]
MIQRSIARALCGLVLVCASASTLVQTAPNSPSAQAGVQAGVLKSVRGDVRLLATDGSMRTAQSGDVVAPIDRIVTGPTTQDGGMLIALLQGSARMITGLIGKTHPDAVRVETPTAVISIRGTDFIVQADPQP